MYIFLFLISTFISAVSQIMLKNSAKNEYTNIWKEYLNKNVIMAYGLFFLSSVITFIAYRYVPLSKGVVLETYGYVFVFLLGYFVLREDFRIKKVLAMLLIIIGIIISNI